MAVQDVKRLLQEGPVSPDSKVAFLRYLSEGHADG